MKVVPRLWHPQFSALVLHLPEIFAAHFWLKLTIAMVGTGTLLRGCSATSTADANGKSYSLPDFQGAVQGRKPIRDLDIDDEDHEEWKLDVNSKSIQ
jgi:hypothetical protein